jgi:YfiR/HmsC-like
MNKIKVMNKPVLKTIIFLVFAISANSFAQDMAVPVKLQSVLFKKIFAFDKTLVAKGSYEVAVIGSSSDEVVAAFKEAGINVKAVSGDQVPADAAVVYIMPGVSSTKQQTASKGVLSISGVTSSVENGDVAIGLGVEGGKPKIIVNMNQLKAEGQELSADLLKISKVIQ